MILGDIHIFKMKNYFKRLKYALMFDIVPSLHLYAVHPGHLSPWEGIIQKNLTLTLTKKQ